MQFLRNPVMYHVIIEHVDFVLFMFVLCVMCECASDVVF